MTSHNLMAHITQSMPMGCADPMQVVGDALLYFSLHFQDPILMPDLALSLDTSLRCLDFSFARIRGMLPLQALQEYRLNRLFSVLTEQPGQELASAIQACGLGETSGVVALFEQEFGMEMPLFLYTCRRAADDRQFRQEHPEPEALVLPV